MDTIIIIANAAGYASEGLEEKTITRTKILEKSHHYQELDETDYKKVVFFMTAMVRSIKREFPDEQSDVLDHADNRLEEINFRIEVRNVVNDLMAVYDEASFFEKAAAYEAVSSSILDYVEVTAEGEGGERLWTHEEIAAGTFAMRSLVFHNKKWIPEYIRFLRSNDLEHEGYQTNDINDIILKYDWCNETLKLAAARLVSCCGQDGMNHFNILLKNGLNAYLEFTPNRRRFFEEVLSEFEYMDNTADGRELLSDDKDYYLGWRNRELIRVNAALTEREMILLRQTVERRWDTIHRQAS